MTLLENTGTDIISLRELSDAQIHEVWDIYHESFSPLAILAAERHMHTLEEFVAEMKDERYRKILAMSPQGQIIGVGSVTRHLETLPWISLPFYKHRWAQQFQDQSIFYINFVGVHSDHRRTSAFADIFAELLREVIEHSGVAAMDFCRMNVEKNKLPKIFGRYARHTGYDPVISLLDEQSYWSYDFTAC